MRWFSLLAVAVLSGPAIYGGNSSGGADEQHPAATQPPVLRVSEPTDSVVFKLPGVARAAAPEPAALPATEVHLAPPPPDPERPILHRPKLKLPPELEEDSRNYLSQQIGIWQQTDAQSYLGDPTRLRPAYSDGQTVNGQILAFPDPTGRYKEVELDFDEKTGVLRTLFVYPFNMTWQECEKAFGGNVQASQAKKGRTFYSYLERRLDVLVDATGKVISLGMY